MAPNSVSTSCLCSFPNPKVCFYPPAHPHSRMKVNAFPPVLPVCCDSQHASVCVRLHASVFWIIALAFCVFGSARLPFWICFFGRLHCLPRPDPPPRLFIPVSRSGFFWRLINIAEPKLLCLRRRLHRDPKAQIQACLAHILPICFQH